MADNYRELMQTAADAAKEAGDWLLQRFGGAIQTDPKGRDSVVTSLDLDAERMIRERIGSRYPKHTLIGEEFTPNVSAGECSWAIDPIDGTRNFAAGIPLWAVSVAALEHGSPVAGVAYLPVTGELFQTARGHGAWLGEERLHVSRTATLADSVVMTDLLSQAYPQGLPATVFAGLIAASRRTRMLGSVCCSVCYVAAGRFDLYYRPQVNVWDVAAAVLLVREAGGEVRSFEGEEWQADTNSILAANPALVEQFLAEKDRLMRGAQA
ncbi:MAG: inositol monophosphatase [Chloroflexota bacterium]|nr:inositol monophosphatase [Chloroflexota bacterium]